MWNVTGFVDKEFKSVDSEFLMSLKFKNVLQTFPLKTTFKSDDV